MQSSKLSLNPKMGVHYSVIKIITWSGVFSMYPSTYKEGIFQILTREVKWRSWGILIGSFKRFVLNDLYCMFFSSPSPPTCLKCQINIISTPKMKHTEMWKLHKVELTLKWCWIELRYHFNAPVHLCFISKVDSTFRKYLCWGGWMLFYRKYPYRKCTYEIVSKMLY